MSQGHIATEIRSVSVHCAYCEWRTDEVGSLRRLNEHVILAHPESYYSWASNVLIDFGCPYCSYNANDGQNLVAHIHAIHPGRLAMERFKVETRETFNYGSTQTGRVEHSKHRELPLDMKLGVTNPAESYVVSKTDLFDIARQELDAILKTMDIAHGEYAHDNSDALANFRKAGKEIGLPKEKVFYIFANKHWQGIIADINGNKGQRESVHGRIRDMLVYLLLFKAMVIEDERNGIRIAPSNTP
jgi:hypothetical protein